MLRALAADAVFLAALFVEALASLSLLQSVQAVALAEAFEPMLRFYRGELAPLLAIGANVVWHPAPQWFVDASVLSAILFFLFFIAQARKSMAPYEPVAGQPSRAEAAVDWLLPVVFCAAGALVLGATLLPLLTVPAALVLGAGQRMGRFRWFELSRGYYFNLLCLGAISGAALMLQR
jgi:hypothetical protein